MYKARRSVFLEILGSLRAMGKLPAFRNISFRLCTDLVEHLPVGYGLPASSSKRNNVARPTIDDMV